MNTQLIIKIIKQIAQMIEQKADILTELDRLIGDGDHGINLKRGFDAVMVNINEFKQKSSKELLNYVAMTLMSKVGGSSGPFLGTIFLKLAQSDNFAQGILQAADAVQMRGKANVGDKTMVDILTPFASTYNQLLTQGVNQNQALDRAIEKAKEHLDESKNLIARKGRASYLGERSLGVTDPGSQSTYYMLEIVVKELKQND
ncbi:MULTISPECIES: dihydroxyacetone kinase subunit DhaL [unclassified Mycoplasma]|uniref:dihydroxyacetone kinase subunit DhaL n=1 Tax=unclassified Mycoplasma TaxID=2683645 RepID=UPI00211CD0CB|nr:MULTISPECIES: dihydroxyacetone kinase subunit DhaL [unclassified Mycoplasma]UUM19593.1 dihydroxyacetone kinase subunit DhaL [Mycoplasma sp. 1578d]UUM24513.1 dihydroxyacetone kinase subunit DhaL [Mycoplasma sp. 3686d]